MSKNFKFINGCKANKDTHKTCKNIFDIQTLRNIYYWYSSTKFAHGLTCEFRLKLSITVQTYGVFSILASLTFHVERLHLFHNVSRYLEAGYPHSG